MQKYNLLYDGSILTNEFTKNDARSGIFFVAKNIFHEMLKRDDIKIFLYCELSKYEALREYLKKYNLERDIEIINAHEYTFLYRLKDKSRQLKNKYDKKLHPIKRNLVNLLYPIFSVACRIYNTFSTQNSLRKKLKNIDFFFSPNTKTPTIIKNSKNIQTSVFLHDTIPLIFPEYFPKVLSGKYWIIDLIKSFNKDEIYFANSKCTKQDFLKYAKNITKEQIFVSYLATDKRFIQNKNIEKLKQIKDKYNIPKDKKYVFSLCTIEPRKNLIRTVKTFIKFIEKNNIKDLIFVLGGGHWDKFIKVIENEVDKFEEYKKYIVKAGYIDDDDLPILYSNAEWFVYTSQYEGFGLPPLEAMSCGCPVITSNNSSIPEVVDNAGIMIDFDNDKQHIEAYEKYYFNEKFRQKNLQKGLERTKNFSWEKCVETIVSTLKIKKESK